MSLRTSALLLASLEFQRWRRAPAQVADSQLEPRLRWPSLSTPEDARGIAPRSVLGSARWAHELNIPGPRSWSSYGDSEADIDVWRVLSEPQGAFRPGMRKRGWRPGPWTRRHSSMAVHRTRDAEQVVAAYTRRCRTAIRLNVRGSLRFTETKRPLTPGWPTGLAQIRLDGRPLEDGPDHG